jgi:NAD(P)-dependent dehydrogenase (short-subunit alcohol dehydrogenase family)
MKLLAGRVAIVTGAGRGLGREHALLLAAEGAAVVVNDLGTGRGGAGVDRGPAQEVVTEIRAHGGQAIVNTDDVTDWSGSRRLVRAAVEIFGDLHVLVNNAGILRDRSIVAMSAAEWDQVMRVHLRGHFLPTRWAARHWRAQAQKHGPSDRALIHTTSTSGLIGNFGQANYGAAKAGIAAFNAICHIELAKYGVRSNAIAPAARRRLTEGVPGAELLMGSPTDSSTFDVFHPGNVSPLVAALASERSSIAGQVFFARGGVVSLMQPWTFEHMLKRSRRWKVDELTEELEKLAEITFERASPQEVGAEDEILENRPQSLATGDAP